ncbi:MAG: DUF4287 domain-containing protein [Anaerolineales bacterium]|nr:DUF4287 domain-containing protein [Anaerolineales bacterium]
MSFQAYLDNIEAKTGKTPNEFIALAKAKGFGPDTKAGEIVAWLKDDFDLGRGHAMALVHVIKNGAAISDKHVNSGGTHSDPSNTLRLTGVRKTSAKKTAAKKATEQAAKKTAKKSARK